MFLKLFKPILETIISKTVSGKVNYAVQHQLSPLIQKLYNYLNTIQFDQLNNYKNKEYKIVAKQQVPQLKEEKGVDFMQFATVLKNLTATINSQTAKNTLLVNELIEFLITDMFGTDEIALTFNPPIEI